MLVHLGFELQGPRDVSAIARRVKEQACLLEQLQAPGEVILASRSRFQLPVGASYSDDCAGFLPVVLERFEYRARLLPGFDGFLRV